MRRKPDIKETTAMYQETHFSESSIEFQRPYAAAHVQAWC